MKLFKIIRYTIEVLFVLLILTIAFIGVDDLVIDNHTIYILLMSIIFILMAVEDKNLGALYSKDSNSPDENYNNTKKGLISTSLLTFLLGIGVMIISPFDLNTSNLLIKFFLTLSIFSSVSMTFYKIVKR